MNLSLVSRGPAFGSAGFGPRLDSPGTRYPPTSFTTISFCKGPALLLSFNGSSFVFLSCYSMLCFILAITICRLPSNNSDPMGDHIPPPNAWRPIPQPNTGTSFNAGFHGMGPPSIPRSGDMALPINAVSINSMILKDVSPSPLIIFFFKICRN